MSTILTRNRHLELAKLYKKLVKEGDVGKWLDENFLDLSFEANIRGYIGDITLLATFGGPNVYHILSGRPELVVRTCEAFKPCREEIYRDPVFEEAYEILREYITEVFEFKE